MLLARLTEYSEQLGGSLPPEFYRPKQIHWILHVKEDGSGAGLVSRRPPPKARDQALITPVPYVQRSGTKVPPYLLVDTAEFVLGRAKNATHPDGPSPKDEEEAQRRHAAYRDLALRWAQGEPDNPSAIALRAFLAAGGLPKQQHPEDLDAKDTVAIMVGTHWLHEDPSVQRVWSQVARERKGGAGQRGLCLICGTLGDLLATIPEPVKKGAIPTTGGSNEGQLISINTSAQGRDGATQLANTPVCDRCGQQAMSTLNHLLASDTNRRRFPDSVMVWWTRTSADDSPMALLYQDQPDPAAVSHLIEAFRQRPSSAAADRVDPNDFYALTLGLNNARIVVREWLEVPLEDLKVNVGAWYLDHGVHDGWTGQSRYVPLWLLALSAGRHDGDRYVKDSAPHGLEADLARCALRRTPPPARLLPSLLQRIRADHHIDAPRVALLRLILNRSADPKDHLMPTLDLSSGDPAYLCGRAFAVLEAVQRTAMRDVNTTIRDKHFSAAVTAPGVVLTQLRIGANAHLKRLRRDRPAAGSALESRLSEVFSAFRDDIPLHLTPREQGRFVIGYEQQRAADRAAAKSHSTPGKSTDPDPEP
ncbi:CRISPR-associated protein [Streptomyces lavendulae subsp. lavendulae]|uniref:CRISPR-associated protein n=1 Tax=Streptomyces lavendulae subsp. lavendulae TaxID=58340 RepID=A0A2K8P6A6_STRLA|nr:type I-C CRISPR-associated protein Cas8c/Csd1 [Streptomyces lavendulae]ATZ21998.1 CRISPR-associated protein [Streptomyces lavendulae subsp. lavendulae]ATZ29573.1 CRISPR-associated protein [Streptomyces lavendulae subsp. lavendulae]